MWGMAGNVLNIVWSALLGNLVNLLTDCVPEMLSICLTKYVFRNSLAHPFSNACINVSLQNPTYLLVWVNALTTQGHLGARRGRGVKVHHGKCVAPKRTTIRMMSAPQCFTSLAKAKRFKLITACSCGFFCEARLIIGCTWGPTTSDDAQTYTPAEC